MAERRYVYRNRLSPLDGRRCRAVLDARGKCIRSRQATMLVEFDDVPTPLMAVVGARQLRKEQR